MNTTVISANVDQIGASLNAVCPYYTMFPLEFPLRALQRRGRQNQWVLDPFCGRGTTTFAARLLGLPSVGLDSNGLAAALAAAKLVDVSPRQVGRLQTRESLLSIDQVTPKLRAGNLLTAFEVFWFGIEGSSMRSP